MRFNEVRRVGVSKAEEKLKRALEVGTAKISIKERLLLIIFCEADKMFEGLRSGVRKIFK